MSLPRLPEGYVAVEPKGVEAFAAAAAADWLGGLLAKGVTLDGWAQRIAVERIAGRGPLHVTPAQVPGPEGRALWAVRHYRRGGAAAGLLVDRYLALGSSRPSRELTASTVARARGVRTPAVVAGAAYASTPLGAFYRADLVTELIPDARSLARSLLEAETDEDTLPPLASAGRLVRSLERAGIFHRDLNAGNVLLDADGLGWVVDLDRCVVLGEGPLRGSAMLARLERSLRKVCATHRHALPRDAWDALRAGFADGA